MNERQYEIQNYRLELDEKTTFADVKKNRINQKIKSIAMSRASSSNIEIKCKLKEGDEFILIPGRIINLSTPTQGIVFEWESYQGEWAEVDISAKEHLVSFTPAQNAVLVSNIASRIESKVLDLFYPMYEHNPKRTKVLEKNLNRIKAVIEMQSFHRYFVGNEEQTDELKTNEELGRSCLAVMPFNKIEINTNDEVWLTADQDFLSPWGTGYSTPSGIVIKITEYLR